MKNKIIFLSITVASLINLNAQGLTQSADGKSTIPLRGAAVGIDIAKTELTLGYNNINQAVQSKKIKWIYGAEVKVKNEEGLGDLFSAGSIVPAGSGNIYTGVTFSNAFNKAETKLEEKRKAVSQAFQKYQADFRTTLKTDLNRFITSVCNQITAGAAQTNALSDLRTPLHSLNNTEEYYDLIKAKSPADDVVRLVYDQVKEFAKKKQAELAQEKTAFIQKLKELHKQFSNINYQRVTFFGFGGISAINFKKYKGIDSTNLSESFNDIDDRGGNIGLGINYQFRNIWLGVTYSYVSSNNYSVLKKSEYTLKTTTAVNSQELISEKKITAFSGTYGEVELNNLNADAVFRLKLDKEFKNYLLINPYLRGSIFPRDTALLPNKTNLGTGFYFLQNDSKLLCGFYIELPDINNNAEKRKPVDDQHILPPLKRLSFGIVAKFNFSSIMGW